MAEPGKWTQYHYLIAVIMVVTGSLNTLAAKWADRLDAKGEKFDHPFVQAVCMFIGESLCLVPFFAHYAYRKWKRDRQIRRDFGDFNEESTVTLPKLNPLVFLPAALCDMTATSVMYVGLTLTNAASFQMLRGAVIIFTGLLSVAFLRSILRAFKWVGMALVLLGLVIVGLADFVKKNDSATVDTNGVITGDLLIIAAQIIVAVQMVYEQKYVLKYDVPPLLAVGLEGVFGMTILSVLIVPFYFISVPPSFNPISPHRLEDALFAFQQMGANPYIILALLGTIFSISFFNFAGISVTKELNATTRMVLDSLRTMVIWAVSLGLRWQDFSYIQIFGFVALLIGMCIYNDILIGPTFLAHHIVPRLPFLDQCCAWYYMAPAMENAVLNRDVTDRSLLVDNDGLDQDGFDQSTNTIRSADA